VSDRSGTPVPPGGEASAAVEAALSLWSAPLAARTGQEGRPHGSVTLHHFGYVRMITCEAGPLRLTHNARPGLDDHEDAVALLLPRGGTLRLAQDGRAACVESGQPVLVDLRRAFSVEQGEHGGQARVLFFRLPVHALHVPAVTLRSATVRALPPSDGAAALLTPLLRHLDESAPRLPAAVGERLGGILTDLVAALVAELAEDAGGSPETGRHQLVTAIRAYIDRHLGDPDLSTERIAVAHLISVRYLHRLFEGEGVTVGRLIQRRRVEQCARELSRRGRVSPSLSAVAARWGFRSTAHFSRAFKAVHGYAPQQWRRLALASATEPVGPADRSGVDGSQLS
jgi:AraC-like DNA-binding protein